MLKAVDLAREPDFALGAAEVSPSMVEVSSGGARFRLQPRIMQVLVALARAEGRVVSRDELTDLCWGGVVVGEDSLNRCIQRLRRLGEEIPESFEVETHPRVGYRLIRRGREDAPPEIAVAGTSSPEPAEDPSPSKEISEPSAAPLPERRAPSVRAARTTSRRAVGRLLIAAVLTCGVAGGGGLVLREYLAPSKEEVVIAPFETPKGSALLQTVGADVVDQINRGLAAANVRVATPSSAPARTPPVTVEGRASLIGGDVEVATRLEGHDHAVLWSARFVRPQGEAEALEEQVAAKVADVLSCAFNRSRTGAPPVSPAALEPFLKVCGILRDEGARDEVLDLLHRVARLDPRSSVAWGDLALAAALAAENMPPEQAARAQAEARDAARRALRLDPNSGHAYEALALAGKGQASWLETWRTLQEGLSVDPANPELLSAEAELLTDMGRLDEALTVQTRAAALDPLSPAKQLHVVWALVEAGRIKQAEEAVARGQRVWPDEEGWREAAVSINLRYDDPEKALAILKSSSGSLSDARRASFERLVRARETNDPAVKSAYVRQELQDFQSGRLQRSGAFLDLANVGAVDAAYEVALGTSVRPGGRGEEDLDPEVLWRPFTEGFRRDPRFITLARRLGLTDFWRATGKWPDFCSVPNWPYDCRRLAEGAKT